MVTLPINSTRAASLSSRNELAVGARDARRARMRLALALSDSLILVIAVGAAQLFRVGPLVAWGFEVEGAATDHLIVSLALIAGWMLALSMSRSRDWWILGQGSAEFQRVVASSAVVLGVVAIVAFGLRLDIARGFLALAFLVGVLALCANRLLARRWLVKRRDRGIHLARALVVGDESEQVARQIENAPAAGIRVTAYASPDEQDSPSKIAARARREGVTTVVLAGGIRGGAPAVRSLGWELERFEIDLVVSTSLIDVGSTRLEHRSADGLSLIHVEQRRTESVAHSVKACVDRVGAALGLLMLLPLFAVIAIAIKAEDEGPIFFRQRRVGHQGEQFSLVKFRTMSVDAEARLGELQQLNEGAGPLFKMKDDPRVTRIGRRLRKYSLDELPQLWNVLVGQMSLVGPRPALPREVVTYEGYTDRRLLVRPGLTGLWQVSGRSDLDWDAGLRLDLHYVDNWSFWRDMSILARTVSVVVRPEGAY